jgi:4-amino-4-deoxy-L-arabinose transferase-like glycosyltransferase
LAHDDDLRLDRPIVWLRLALALGLALSLGGVPWLPLVGHWVLALLVVSVVDEVARSLQTGSLGQRARDAFRSHGFAIALGVIVLIGTSIRLAGVDIDLGHTPIDSDEKRLATTVLHFFETGEVNHATVEDYPGVFFWLLTASSLFVYLAALLQGTAHTLKNAPLEIFVLGGRVTNVLLSAGTTVIVGSLGRMVGGRRAGLVAALIFAVVPLSVQTSTLLRDEAAQALFLVAAVWAAAKLDRSVVEEDFSQERSVLGLRRDTRWALFAGLLAGIATAIKYSSIFVLLSVLAACVLTPMSTDRHGDFRGKAAACLAGLAILGFVAAVGTTNHFLWSDFPNFIRELTTEVAMSGPHHWSAQANPRWYYTRILGALGPGWALCVLAAGYTVWGLGTARRVPTIVVAFPVSYMWFMTERPAQFPRWIYPLVPFVAVAGATTLWALIDGIQPKLLQITSARGAVRWLSTSLVIAALIQPLWRSSEFVNRTLAAPTHVLVEEWLRSHASAGDRVLVAEKWLDLRKAAFQVNRVPSLGPVLGGGTYQLCYNDWVVVPEPDMRRTEALKRLRLVETFRADSSFSGNQGFDFAVYATERLQPSDETIDFALDREEARIYLGSEWPLAEAGSGGRPLPRDGASIYLPPRGYTVGRLEVELQVTNVGGELAGTAALDDAKSAPIVVEIDNEPLAGGVRREGSRILWSSVPMTRGASARRVVRVRLIPAEATKTARVFRFAVRR